MRLLLSPSYYSYIHFPCYYLPLYHHHRTILIPSFSISQLYHHCTTLSSYLQHHRSTISNHTILSLFTFIIRLSIHSTNLFPSSHHHCTITLSIIFHLKYHHHPFIFHIIIISSSSLILYHRLPYYYHIVIISPSSLHLPYYYYIVTIVLTLIHHHSLIRLIHYESFEMVVSKCQLF